MSEPARQHNEREELSEEIGDVLASIRKLLALKQGPAETQAALIAEEALTQIARPLIASELAAERLVLGNEARVVPLNPAEKRTAQDVAPIVATAQAEMPTVAVQAPQPAEAMPVDPAVLAEPRPGSGDGAGAPTGLAEDLAEEFAPVLAEAAQEDLEIIETTAGRDPVETRAYSQKDNTDMLDQTNGAANETFDLFGASPAEDTQLPLGNALRDLVREVLLEEFQGELGSRISRNLRRAVHQEVASAIAAGLKA